MKSGGFHAMLQPNQILHYLALKYEGDWDKISQAVRGKEIPDDDAYKKLVSTCHSKFVTLVDPEYPSALRQSFKPPIVLFYYGDLSILGNGSKCISYVGSRNSSPYGNEMAKTICSGLSKYGYRIVSGLARGIDVAALSAALDSKGGAIAVLGNGIDFCYPSENTPVYERIKKEGLVVSEYPGMTKPTVETFPLRNRIVAGLSKATVVGEAARRSGTLITVNYAMSSNKDVGCVPYRATDQSACNALIKEGAFVIESPEDVLLMVGDIRGEREPSKT